MSAVDDAVSFEQNIKPLFREMDRESMREMFDLWAYEDVRSNSDAILSALQQGSMPCDGSWPQEQTALFERWVQSGMAP